MVGPGRNNQYSSYRQQPQMQGRGDAPRAAAQEAAPAQAKRLPAEFVDLAEELIKKGGLPSRNAEGKYHFRITRSKIRRIFSLFTDILNDERLRSDKELLPENERKLMMARVRLAYEAGRDKEVETFIKNTELLEYVKGVGKSREEFMRLANFMESLVAWHRYYSDEKK